MSTFTPVNSLEIALRALITDKNTPVWSFYTPLAAAYVWIIIKRYPEIDGSDLLAPEGQNPALCIFHQPQLSFAGIYTAECRAAEICEKWSVPLDEYHYVAAPGFPVLQLVSQGDYEVYINAGLPDCQYHLDGDLVDILLQRPSPNFDEQRGPGMQLHPAGDPQQYLGPLREFLCAQPTVRAAWIFGAPIAAPLRPGHHAYELHLLMEEPEDRRLDDQVLQMAKALTPVEMEWNVASMMGDDKSLSTLSKQQHPFYQAPDFLKNKAHS